jgi:prolipoprotein diacylglyceryltransferase
LAVDEYQVGTPPYEPRHDLGLYEIFWSLAAIGLFALLARKKRPIGFFAALLPLSYTPIRFFLDYLRAEPAEGGDLRYAGFTPGQYASIGIFLLGVWMMWWVHTRPTPVLPDELKWPPPEGDAAATAKPSGSTKKKRSRAAR